MKLVELLEERGLDTDRKIKLLRHVGSPGLDISELFRLDFLNDYQSVHGQEYAIGNCEMIVSFVRLEGQQAWFAGVWEIVEHLGFGVAQVPPGFPFPAIYDKPCWRYRLEPVPGFEDLVRKLIIDWGEGTRSWFQWSHKQPKEVVSLDGVTALGGWQESDEAANRATESAAEVAEESAARSRGQGFSSSPEQRRAVELRAMFVANAYFEGRKYVVKNTSANKPYDLVATKADERIFIEVKGTTTGGERVFLTKNEVAHAQGHPGECVLFVLANISVEHGDDGKLIASGGTQNVIWPWNPAAEDLVALSFQYSLPSK